MKLEILLELALDAKNTKAIEEASRKCMLEVKE